MDGRFESMQGIPAIEAGLCPERVRPSGRLQGFKGRWAPPLRGQAVGSQWSVRHRCQLLPQGS